MEWVDEVLDKVRKDFMDEAEDLIIDYKSQEFIKNYSYNKEVSEDILEREEVQMAKQALDDCFNQWLAMEENHAEYVFNESFHGVIDSLPYERVLEMFYHYFEGWLPSYIKAIGDSE